MNKKVKAPKVIYLQWDDDVNADNTWSEDQINDDDIKYIRPGRSTDLENQLAERDALIERLTEAWEAGDVLSWGHLIAEYRESKKETK